MRRNNLKGFTLAEVLITLTIIGVIAALTIPNLMQSWRRHERITQIKTAYSILSNSLKMAVAEHGSSDWTWTGCKSSTQRTDDCTWNFVSNYFLPYVKVQETCGMGGHDRKSTKCFAKGNSNSGMWYWLNGKTSDEQNSPTTSSMWYTLILQNGMHVAIASSPNSPQIYFAVDVNGKKGPTKAGIDVFGFRAELDDNYGTYISTNISNRDKFKNYQEVMTKGLYRCNTTASVAGLNCTHLLELNHWEFPDDYPVKKF